MVFWSWSSGVLPCLHATQIYRQSSNQYSWQLSSQAHEKQWTDTGWGIFIKFSQGNHSWLDQIHLALFESFSQQWLRVSEDILIQLWGPLQGAWPSIRKGLSTGPIFAWLGSPLGQCMVISADHSLVSMAFSSAEMHHALFGDNSASIEDGINVTHRY